MLDSPDWGEDGADEDEDIDVDDEILSTPAPAELPPPYEWVLAEESFPGTVHKWNKVCAACLSPPASEAQRMMSPPRRCSLFRCAFSPFLLVSHGHTLTPL